MPAMPAAGCGRPAAGRTPPSDRTATGFGHRGRAVAFAAVSGTLAERLGYGADARVLIVTCDDLGSCHSANLGVYDCLNSGLATSAALMVPCPWAREAASRYRGEDVGVHLTLNAEHDLYRWGPITHSPSLLDGDGGFPRTVADLWDHADLDEVRRECRAQIERAIYWGFDVTFLSSHLDTMSMRPEFFDVAVDLAIEFRLPMRLPGPDLERSAGFPLRQLAADEGIVMPDHVIHAVTNARSAIERALLDTPPGVTEVALHPAVDASELRSLAPDWGHHVEAYEVLTESRSIRGLVERAGATLIGYRDLRALMRAG